MIRPFLIDTDTASDDAVALVMALLHPDIDVKAITVVAGNVPLEQGVANALYTIEQSGREVPVFKGAARPLKREPVDATWFHGDDGMGDQHYPLARRGPEKLNAVDAIRHTVRTTEGIELVTLGPLTNVALALREEPSLVNHIRRCVVMGGAACTVGNVTPAAEYNIWCDPEAADIVFTSGLRIEMVGWELSRGEANLNERDIAGLRDIDTPLAHFCIDCNRRSIEANKAQSGEIGIPLPDPVAMAVAIDPSICTHRSTHRVMVDTGGELTRGMTVVDRLNVGGDPRNHSTWRRSRPVSVCWEIAVPRWKAMLLQLLAAR
jgi:purine nucleosidase